MKNKTGERIKECRLEAGLTQKELADFLNVDWQTISRWECGDRNPKRETLLLMASRFQVSTDYLLGVEDEETNIIGENIKTYREHQNLTQDELASRIGVNIQDVMDWEQKTKSPDYNDICKMTEVFDCVETDLLEEHRPIHGCQTWGVVLKYYRKKANISLDAFAKALSVDIKTINKWEQPDNDNIPAKYIQPIIKILNLTMEYINGETDHLPLSKPTPNAHPGKFIEIPLLSMEMVASCGVGNGLYGVEADMTETIPLAWNTITRYDDMRKPFAIHTEGDSMEGAGLEEGSVAIINPSEEIVSGDMALVVYNDAWFIKWVVYNPDGSVDLRSANPAYSTIRVDAEYARESAWFSVIGKVIRIIRDLKPKRAF